MGIEKVCVGQRYGRLIVLERAENYIEPSGKTVRVWKCQCDCGNIKYVKSHNLLKGHTKSCGCLNLEKMTERIKKYNSQKKNTYDLSNEYGIGYTVKGEIFYFDKEDYDIIKNYYWHRNNLDYMISIIDNSEVRMHRLIMNAKNGYDIDHINHITYDNRKSNLREVAHIQNMWNSKVHKNNTTGKAGVKYSKQKNKYTATITVNGNRIYLGDYDELEDAIEARKDAESKYYKEYAFRENEEEYSNE